MFAAHKAAMASSGEGVSITNRSISKAAAGAVTVSYQLTNGGLVRKSENGAYTTLETWLLSGSASDYEARVPIVGGDSLSSGTVGSWLNLGTSREWQQYADSSNTFTSNFTVEIRLAASPFTVLDSATINLTAVSA